MGPDLLGARQSYARGRPAPPHPWMGWRGQTGLLLIQAHGPGGRWGS